MTEKRIMTEANEWTLRRKSNPGSYASLKKHPAKKELVEILNLWDGITLQVPVGCEETQVVDLVIGRGIYVPEYMLRLDMQKRDYARLGIEIDGHAGVISWLEIKLNERGYTNNTELAHKYKPTPSFSMKD